MMDQAKKERPNVLITTYSSYITAPPRQQEQLQRQQPKQHQQQALVAVDECERSTDLFSGKRSHCSGRANVLFELHQIRGPNGSVRGHKDVVRKSLQNIKVVASNSKRNFNSTILPTFMGSNSSSGSSISSNHSNCQTVQRLDERQQREDYLEKLIEDEQNQCVVYITTLGIIRRTFEDSRLMKSILNLNLINYEERDIYLNQVYKHQLRIRCKSITVPALFVDGHFLGGIKELEAMNENGKLGKLLAKFKMSDLPREVCSCCGGAKFIACQSCNGSRKSTVRHFKFSSIALRCIKCDKNDGLVQCPSCCYLQQPTMATFDCNNNDDNDSNELSCYPSKDGNESNQEGTVSPVY